LQEDKPLYYDYLTDKKLTLEEHDNHARKEEESLKLRKQAKPISDILKNDIVE